jgi:hypothetical protein
MERRYSNGSRFVACRVKLSELVVIGEDRPDKGKAPRVLEIWEVDEDGNPVETQTTVKAAA